MVPSTLRGLRPASSSLVLNDEMSDQVQKVIKTAPDQQKNTKLAQNCLAPGTKKVNCLGFRL